MKALLLCLIVLPLIAPRAFAGEKVELAGWGIDEKHLEAFMPQAREVGFDALITWNTDPEVLRKCVDAAKPYGIRIFSSLAPMGGIAKLWTQRYPDRPMPWQVMSPDEDAALRFITAGKNQFLIGYQFGGEPALTHEVLTSHILCFSSREGRELFKPVVDGIVSVPGIAGLAFDGFGYQNYRDCQCERCQAGLAAYRQARPEMKPEAAEVEFFRDLLVGTINELADYARAQRGDLQTAIHIWPVFAPEPLYGNRLDLDFCGQTAAWYTLWPEEKIAAYSRTIAAEATKFHPRQQGVGMIGYYDRPGQFPVKDAACVDMELRTMIEGGCRHLQVCSAQDVIRKPEIAAVFRKYCR